MITEIQNIAARLAENTQDKPVIYVAGKVTGMDYSEAYNNFKVKQIELEEKGYFVLNPCDLVASDLNNWKREMRVALVALVCARYLALLPNWYLSPGAKLERSLAMILGISIIAD
ncbi:DUF4406 domain-containing protein [Mucilaginibacter glaciei]|uniref:DUF4406 domain-containing protein n=1 Tax=Mucilaginibacter glaciei TaxID=2772109 RepID=A0A926S2L7_9SPHI|nr:DUF4406 domain-containing protein [Mucilaginibacter glaciei]MBD1394283.1 DUF4406 domain-containing protein [Mucilaginibacter glaciei]